MSEKQGTLIGLSNVLTKARTRVAPGADLDADPKLRERLSTQARRALEGRESFIHDAVLLGRRVRLFSNSHHLADFWRENFPGEAEWRAATGQIVPREIALTVYAVINVPQEPEASYVSVGRQEVYLFNSSYYGGLRASVMEAMGRLIGKAGYLLHAAAVEIAGRTLVLTYPAEVIHPTPTWGLMENPAAKFIADGWLAMEPSGKLHSLEKGVYFRTSMIESYPEYAARVLFSRFENVPDLSPSEADTKAAIGEGLDRAARKGDSTQGLRGLPPERTRELLLRLAASPDARAVVPAVTLFGKSRLSRGGVAAAVFALQAGAGDPLTPATIEPFPCPGYEVRVGAFSGHPREIARRIAAT